MANQTRTKKMLVLEINRKEWKTEEGEILHTAIGLMTNKAGTAIISGKAYFKPSQYQEINDKLSPLVAESGRGVVVTFTDELQENEDGSTTWKRKGVFIGDIDTIKEFVAEV